MTSMDDDDIFDLSADESILDSPTRNTGRLRKASDMIADQKQEVSKKPKKKLGKKLASMYLDTEARRTTADDIRGEFQAQRAAIAIEKMKSSEREQLLRELSEEEERVIAAEQQESDGDDDDDEDEMDSEDERFAQEIAEADNDSDANDNVERDRRRRQRLDRETERDEDKAGMVSGRLARDLGKASTPALAAGMSHLSDHLTKKKTTPLERLTKIRGPERSAAMKEMVVVMVTELIKKLEPERELEHKSRGFKDWQVIKYAGVQMDQLCKCIEEHSKLLTFANGHDKSTMDAWMKMFYHYYILWRHILPKAYPEQGKLPAGEEFNINALGTSFYIPTESAGFVRSLGGLEQIKPGVLCWQMTDTSNVRHYVADPDRFAVYEGLAILYTQPSVFVTMVELALREEDHDSRKMKAPAIAKIVYATPRALHILDTAYEAAHAIDSLYYAYRQMTIESAGV